jgi:hypothetical protein
VASAHRTRQAQPFFIARERLNMVFCKEIRAQMGKKGEASEKSVHWLLKKKR